MSDMNGGLVLSPVSSTCRRCEAKPFLNDAHTEGKKKRQPEEVWKVSKGETRQQQLKTNSTADLVVK